MHLTWQLVDAPARIPFRIARHTYTSFPLVQVTLALDGVTGHGEAPPNRFYGETSGTVEAVLPLLARAVEDPWDWDGWQRRSRQVLGTGHPAARSALECALLDWCGREAGLPLWRLLGLTDAAVPESSASFGIDSLERTQAAARAAWDAGWRRLKVKLGWGRPQEEAALLQQLRQALPEAVLTADANGGWSRQHARQMLPVLADVGVELIEQPLAVGDESGTARLAEQSAVPVLLDESIQSARDVQRFADACHGVNVKVSKLGGPLESLRAIRTAREHHLLVMLGCMGESSLSLAPAVHLAPLVDHADLYGPHALADDPSTGLSWNGPVVARPDIPGLGVSARAR